MVATKGGIILTFWTTWRCVLLGSNKGKITILKSETLELLQEITIFEGKNCQIRSMVLSNSGQVGILYA